MVTSDKTPPGTRASVDDAARARAPDGAATAGDDQTTAVVPNGENTEDTGQL